MAAPILDTSYPRVFAESDLRVTRGSLSLDELAAKLSLLIPNKLLSVRDTEMQPVPQSNVYLNGQAAEIRH
jgi:hypothetical protein